MYHFCTLFDRNYLLKGLALLRSLRRNCPDAIVYVLCMDDLTYQILSKINIHYVHLLHLSEIEDEQLLSIKSTRSVAEYCWTLSPCLPWYIFKKNQDLNFITYLDADIYFYSSLKPIFEEIEDASIVVIEHRFAESFKSLEINGRFCVEWVSFKRDEQGLRCLKRWREQCIDWCYHRLEDDRMGDQKYLDEWPQNYNRLKILDHIGAGVAPWNYSKYEFGIDKDDLIIVDGKPLIFYHFHQFQILSSGSFDRLSLTYRKLNKEPERVYLVYEKAIKISLKEVELIVPGFSFGFKSMFKTRAKRLAQYFLPNYMKSFLKKVVKVI